MDSLDLRDGRYLKTHIIFSSIFPEFKLFGGLYPSLAHFLPKNGICGPQWEAHQFLLFYWLVFYQGNGDLWVAFVIVCAIILSCVGIALSSWLKAQTMILKRDNPSSRPFFESGRMWLVRGIPQQENFHPVWCWFSTAIPPMSWLIFWRLYRSRKKSNFFIPKLKFFAFVSAVSATNSIELAPVDTRALFFLSAYCVLFLPRLFVPHSRRTLIWWAKLSSIRHLVN